MKFAFVDYRISNEEIYNLINLNIKPLRTPKMHGIYDAVNGHTDIQIFQTALLKNSFIINKDIDTDFLNDLIFSSANYYFSESEIGAQYPQDIILNAVSTDNFLMHNLKYTDKKILASASSKTLIDIKQGYTRCSCAIVSNDAFITNDKGIYEALTAKKYDVLLLPYGDIELEGFEYGFIGGACGLIDNNTMAFFGNLDKYKYGTEVKKFLKKHNVEPVYLHDGGLIDRGSLLVFNNEDKDPVPQLSKLLK